LGTDVCPTGGIESIIHFRLGRFLVPEGEALVLGGWLREIECVGIDARIRSGRRDRGIPALGFRANDRAALLAFDGLPDPLTGNPQHVLTLRTGRANGRIHLTPPAAGHVVGVFV
jgi:hypothetical protein